MEYVQLWSKHKQNNNKKNSMTPLKRHIKFCNHIFFHQNLNMKKLYAD